MIKIWTGIAVLAVAAAGALAPSGSTQAPPAWAPLTTGSTASLRGLSVASPRVIWASGTAGTYLKTTDGGEHWAVGQVPGAERLDFRDVKAFSDQVAYLMGIDKAGGIYKTIDGGQHWTQQYANPKPGSDFFLDCLGFWDAERGLALGDPSGGTFLLLRTRDGGAHWTPADKPPVALAGDGVFAASGTSLVMMGKSEAWFGTGGTSGARVFHSTDGGATWTAVSAPLTPATPAAGAGIFSLAFWDKNHGVAVGGDYTKPIEASLNLALTSDGGKTWTTPAGPVPGGYRSGVAAAPKSAGPTLIAVGTSGSDISRDGGKSWTALGKENFNSVAFLSPAAAIAAGPRGRIAKLLLGAGPSAPAARVPLMLALARGP